MSIWHIYGGNRLTGSTQVQGAKNAVLPIMAASVLAGSETVLHNVPDLKDVTITLRILRHLGCTAERDGDTVRIDSRDMNRNFIPHDLMRELRSSVIFLGAILTRFGTASLSMPGGCELGPRPVNLHLDALRALEASGESSLPVAGADGRFRGMLSPAKLLALFIAKDDLSRPTGEAPLHACSQVLAASDRVHDVKAACIRNAHNHFPVVDEDGRLLGTVLKRAFAEIPPFRMILVDHNEIDQGIPGLEELPILEVVDHHRISFTSTPEPIKYTADTVGSTCTIVARMFRGAGLRPSKAVAGVLLAGIVADTLFFQSPTTTEADRTFAAWLEKISGATAQELMDGMMSVASALSALTPAKAVDSDRKTYAESGWTFSLAQLEESNLALFHNQIDVLGAELDRVLAQEKLDFVALLVTDPVRAPSELLFRGAESVRRALPWRTHARGTFLLPGVLSRKKQLLPEVLSTLSGLAR